MNHFPYMVLAFFCIGSSIYVFATVYCFSLLPFSLSQFCFVWFIDCHFMLCICSLNVLHSNMCIFYD